MAEKLLKGDNSRKAQEKNKKKIKYATEIWNAMTDGNNFSVGEKVIIQGFCWV